MVDCLLSDSLDQERGRLQTLKGSEDPDINVTVLRPSIISWDLYGIEHFTYRFSLLLYFS